MTDIHARDDGDLRKYRTEIPNIVFDLGLDPYALALYCHLKRTAGATSARACYKSTRTLAEETGMSLGKVSQARVALEESFGALGGKSLIRVERPKDQKKVIRVTCVDVWEENFDTFIERSRQKGKRAESEAERSPGERSVHEVNTPERSSGERKKERFKKEPTKERENARAREGKHSSQEDYQAQLEKFIAEDPLGGRVRAMLDLRITELENDGRQPQQRRASTWWNEFPEQIRRLREENLSDAAIAHGMDEAIRSEKPNMKWAEQSARKYRPKGTREPSEGFSSNDESVASASVARDEIHYSPEEVEEIERKRDAINAEIAAIVEGKAL